MATLGVKGLMTLLAVLQWLVWGVSVLEYVIRQALYTCLQTLSTCLCPTTPGY